MSMSMSASASAKSKSKTLQNEHFFRYTNGRWLWDEEKQLQERYRKFNVEELKRIGAESIGAKSCVSITKLDEGGYNKVFKLVMDNGSVAIARIPCPNAGPPFKTTASEVATMDFARTILNIPVPKVHAWSAVSDDPVEAEYILMEEACGTSLGDVWENMGIHSKDKIVKDIVSIEQKLLSVSFSRLAPQDTIWKTTDTARHVTWLSQYAPRETPPSVFQKSAAQESPDAHIALYKKYLDISLYILPKDERMVRSTLWHWDLHASNLFVKDDQVTCIIDWQSNWAGPLFVQYRYPKIVHYAGEVVLRLPEDYESIEGNEKVKASRQVERSLVQYLYGAKTKKKNPLLTNIIDIPQRTNHMRDGEGFNEQADFWDRLEGFIARDGWTSNERYEEALEMFASIREEGLKQLTGEERLDFEKQSRWAQRSADRADGS
ncbi:hypothetical protein ACEPPN_000272 [Leptodophora sp. 'Broadleaf-Isolate-01']